MLAFEHVGIMRLIGVPKRRVDDMLFLMRVLRMPGWHGHRHEAPRMTLPAIVVGIVAQVAGEVTGYLAGLGPTEARLAEYEIRRAAYVRGKA